MSLKINLIHIMMKCSWDINQHFPNLKTQTKNPNKNHLNQKSNKRTPSNQMLALRLRIRLKNKNRKRNKIIIVTIQYLARYQQILYQIIILEQKKIIVRRFKEEVVDLMHKLMGKLQNLWLVVCYKDWKRIRFRLIKDSWR